MSNFPWGKPRNNSHAETALFIMAKTKILLVEDDAVLAKVIYEELGEAGFETLQAYDGETGLTMARERQPDLILLDVLLPKKNGLEVLEALKNSPSTKKLSVIMLTMLGSDDDIKKGLALGANDYIVKSQHALPEIVEKIKGFFAKEQHPEVGQPGVPNPDA
jgi:DNA-binding response OmpR family regulator